MFFIRFSMSKGVLFSCCGQYLIEGPGEERGEGGDEDDGSVAARGAGGHAHQVLLCDETLDVPVSMFGKYVVDFRCYIKNKLIRLFNRNCMVP